MRLTGWLVLATAAAALATDQEATPLFDSRHAPAVLVEARRLAEPPRLDPNRLVRGWAPWRRGDGTYWLVPWDNARLQWVDLESRPRRLIFQGEVLGGGEEWARVTIEGVERRVPLGDDFALELPPATEPGRRQVGFRLERPGSYALRAVAIEPAHSVGGARCEAATCRQTGPSVIEAVRRVEPGTRLSGVFVPPTRPGADQRFEILMRDEKGGERVLFSWRARGRRFVIGRRPFDVEIAGRRPGWVRLRLRATGQGSAAVWRSLRLHEPVSEALPSPRPPAAPRLVVLYVMDAWRADHVGHLGGETGLTPAIDHLAESGATFRRHLSVAPNTLPATKALFTGRVSLLRGGRGLGQNGPRTLAEAFADAGYRTAAVSGNGHVSRRQGTARGFEHVEESVLFGDEEYQRDSPGYNDSAARVHRAALAWLDRLEEGAPAFLYLHTIHPHTPYDPPPDLVARFTGGLASRIDGGSQTLREIAQGRYRPTADEQQRLARLYAASVAYNDRELGKLLGELGKRFRPEEVLFVLTSDHGEELFDHGGVLHGYTLYDEQLHVPLVVNWPGSVAAMTVDAPSDTLDVHHGLLALVDRATAAGRPGFWRHLAGRMEPGPEPTVQFAAAASVPGGIFAARTERWKLIWAPQVRSAWGMGGGFARTHDWEYLFDLANGDESVNLAGARHPEVDWLRSRLAAWIETGLAQEAGGEVPRLDEKARQRLRALGYLD